MSASNIGARLCNGAVRLRGGHVVLQRPRRRRWRRRSPGGGVRHGPDLHRVARPAGDVIVCDQVNVQQAIRAVTGPLVVEFGQRLAPALEPAFELEELLPVAREMHQQIDVAVRPGGAVLHRPVQVHALDREAAGVQGPHHALGHAEAPAPELARLVQVALDHLPPKYGDALEWKYIQGYSVKEIAGRLNLSPEAAQSLLARAKRAFQDIYGTLARPVMKEAKS